MRRHLNFIVGTVQDITDANRRRRKCLHSGAASAVSEDEALGHLAGALLMILTISRTVITFSVPARPRGVPKSDPLAKN